jgi:hypothetical protein
MLSIINYEGKELVISFDNSEITISFNSLWHAHYDDWCVPDGTEEQDLADAIALYAANVLNEIVSNRVIFKATYSSGKLITCTAMVSDGSSRAFSSVALSPLGMAKSLIGKYIFRKNRIVFYKWGNSSAT